MTNPRAAIMLEQLGDSPQFRLAPQAKMLSKALKETDYSSFAAYKEFIPPEVQERFLKGNLSYAELSVWLDQARESVKVNAKEQAKAQILQQAMNTPVDKRNAYQTQLVEEHQAASELKRADIELKKAQAEKARQESLRGPADNSTLNKIHQMVAGGQGWVQGTPDTQRQALDTYSKLYPEGRLQVQMGTPVSPKERVNIIKRSDFLHSGAMVQAPPGISEWQLRAGDYIEITDKQKEAWGEVVNSGLTLQTLFALVDPLITATTPVQALKQYGRLSLGAVSKKIPAAATYLADSEAFSSRMARVFGSEVGVLTQGDVNRWMRALPTFGDTKTVSDMKKRVFLEIYQQARTMAIKKIAGEDITKDLATFRSKTLSQVESVNPPSLQEDLQTLFGDHP